MRTVLRSFGWSLLFAACGGNDSQPPVAVAPFPADYQSSYTEVRNCRPSSDHELNNIRILVDQNALSAYQTRATTFPVDAVVLKEEYDFSDTECTGPVKQFTVMKRLATGSAPNMLDWHWYQVDADRNIRAENASGCYGCHIGCGKAPDGHDGTCAVP